MYVPIKKLEAGPISQVCLIKEINQLHTKDKKRPFTSIVLTDKSGEIKAFVWDKHLTHLRPNTFIKLSGEVKEHEGSMVLRVNEQSITPINTPKNLEDYVYSLDCLSVSNLWEELQGFIQAIQDPFFKGIVNSIINEHENFGVFNLRNCPLTIHRFGQYHGALLEHIIYCARNAKSFQQNYFDRNAPIDPDLLLAILVLHDMGNLKAFTNFNRPQLKVQAKLHGKTCLSLGIVRGAVNEEELSPIEEIKLAKLEHGIMAATEYMKPKFIEAMLAQKIQEMDTLLGVYSRAINFAGHDQEFTDVPYLDTEVYNG